jgi:hypothetical protein
MSEYCKIFVNCNFVKVSGDDDDQKQVLRGFISKYCQGKNQEQCIRKKMSKALGSPERVPANLMPNGLPLPGTGNKNWSTEVKMLL